MREIRSQFAKLFRTRAGDKFYGELSNPIERTTPADFRSRRHLMVSDKSPVRTGEIVTCENQTFLISLASTFTDILQFKAYEITHRLNWSRMAETIDFVTGLPRDTQLLIIDQDLPVIVEYGGITANNGIETDRYRIMTGADVQVGDRLGPWLVNTRKEALGLNVLEVS